MILKNSKIVAAFLLIFVQSSVSFFSFSQLVESNNQLLWQISGKGIKKPSYLFGSYHSNDARLFHFSDSTYIALLQADAIVLEADVKSLFPLFDSRSEEVQLKFDSKGNPYTNSIKASQTKYGNEDGWPQFLDAYFQDFSSNARKKFYALETVESQLSLFSDLSFRKLINFNLSETDYSQERILNIYLRGDIEKMRQILQTQFSDKSNTYKLLITDRNIKMAQGIDTLCRKESLFIAVGAGHLAGSEGIIQLLRNKGYTVRQVLATFSEKPSDVEKKVRSFKKYDFVNPELLFYAKFGGRPVIDTTENSYKLVYQEMGQGNTYWVEVVKLQKEKNLYVLLDELFYSPEKAKLSKGTIHPRTDYYEGITEILGVGNVWRRVFIYEGNLYKLSCYGGNKFMNSNRPKLFFDRFELLE